MRGRALDGQNSVSIPSISYPAEKKFIYCEASCSRQKVYLLFPAVAFSLTGAQKSSYPVLRNELPGPQILSYLEN